LIAWVQFNGLFEIVLRYFSFIDLLDFWYCSVRSDAFSGLISGSWPLRNIILIKISLLFRTIIMDYMPIDKRSKLLDYVFSRLLNVPGDRHMNLLLDIIRHFNLNRNLFNLR
jgi:hypothetical protein